MKGQAGGSLVGCERDNIGADGAERWIGWELVFELAGWMLWLVC